MIRALALFFVGLTFLVFPVRAADYYVDNVSGDDSFTGQMKKANGEGGGPYGTIARALKEAGAGDTVHLNPTGKLYRQKADFYGHEGGVEGSPLTLDGHGATLCGGDPVSAAGWRSWKQGVLTRSDVVPRGFMVVDGEMVFGTIGFNVLRPGEFIWLARHGGRLYFYPPKGRKASKCSVEVEWPGGQKETLDPQTWHHSHSRIGAVRRYPMKRQPEAIWFDDKKAPFITTKNRLEPGEWVVEEDTVYYRPEKDSNLTEMDVQFAVRGNGVQMNGGTAHVVVKNLNVRWVYNDGYNIHGRVTDARFYNCNARDTGDEGFSAHDACETLLDGATYVNNSHSIANVNRSGHSVTRNVVLARARRAGYLIKTGGKGIDAVHHVLEHAVMIDNPTHIAASNTRVNDVLAVSSAEGKVGHVVHAGRDLTVKGLTASGGRIRAGKAPLNVQNSVLDCHFHVRADDPMKVIELRNVILSKSGKIEWGSRYPWKRLSAAEWLKGAERTGAAENCRVEDLDYLLRAVRDGKKTALREEIGCSENTWKIYQEAALSEANK